MGHYCDHEPASSPRVNGHRNYPTSGQSILTHPGRRWPLKSVLPPRLTEQLGLSRQQTSADISLYTRLAPENLRFVIDVTAARCQASTLYYSRWKDIVYREHCGRIE